MNRTGKSRWTWLKKTCRIATRRSNPAVAAGTVQLSLAASSDGECYTAGHGATVGIGALQVKREVVVAVVAEGV